LCSEAPVDRNRTPPGGAIVDVTLSVTTTRRTARASLAAGMLIEKELRPLFTAYRKLLRRWVRRKMHRGDIHVVVDTPGPGNGDATNQVEGPT
jgi:hypothetical protein